jgi:hypothetical protein
MNVFVFLLSLPAPVIFLPFQKMNRRCIPSSATVAAAVLAMAVAAYGALTQQSTASDRPVDSGEALQPAPAERGSEAPSDDEIARWIAELDSGRYQVREQATQRLLGAGGAAMDALLAAANGDRPEPADRAVWILRRLSNGEDVAVRRPVLERLVQLRNRPDVVAEAEQALGEIKSELAIGEITRLGGRFVREGADVPWGRVLADCVVLDDGWKGGDDGLKYLRDLKNVPLVVIIGTDISAQGLTQVQLADSVQALQLYGTRLDAAGAAKLQEAWAGVQIDYRRGALLGVRGIDANGVAMVQTVQEGTAAAAAGIHPRDVIRKIDGQPIANFSELTQRIAKCLPGDEVALEIQRGRQKVEMKVKLGRWQSAGE